MTVAKDHILSLSDYAYQRTRDRLAGLDDAEYFWEPVPGCWTVRRAASGEYHADSADSPEGPPFTTLAWRLWHLIGCYGGERNPRWLGVDRAPQGFDRDDPAPATASAAVAELERAHAFWQDVLNAVPAGSLWEPMGPVAGPYGADDKVSLIFHQLDEQIHHGAELGVLRDLYRHSQQTTR